MFNLESIYNIFSLPIILSIPLVTALMVLLLSRVHPILRDIISIMGSLVVAFLIVFSNKYVSDYSISITLSEKNVFHLSMGVTSISYIFLMITSLAGLFVIIASLKNVKDKGYSMQFHFLIHIVVFGMLVSIMAKDFLTFFVGWEIMTWAGYFIINLSRRLNERTGLYFIAMNVISAFLLLTSFLFIFSYTHSLAYKDALSITNVISPSHALGIIVMMFIGVAIKIGVMPFHIWITDSYDESPDSFTPFLSAAVSKMGIYAFIVFIINIFGYSYFAKHFGSFFNGTVIGYIIGWLGVITSIVSTFKAITQEDIKKLLAYSSIAQLGYIITAFGTGTSTGIWGAVFHTINHSIVKALLFITVAGIIHRTGKTKFYELGGLIYKMPFAFFSILIGIIGLAGMPPLSGFYSKWLIYCSMVEQKWVILLVGNIIASTASYLYCYKLIYGIFLGQPTKVNPQDMKETSITYRIPQLILMMLIVLFGLFPGLLTGHINGVLAELNMTLVKFESITSLITPFGGLNGFIIMAVFVGAFVTIFILFSLFNKSKSRDLHRLDISYSGETPEEDTPLHYGYGMGLELHRIPLVGKILSRSARKAFDFVAKQIKGIFDLIRRINTGDGQRAILFSFILLAILLTSLIFK